MANRDIAQEIINAVASGKPSYVITKLVQERADKKAALGKDDTTPSNETILATAAALAAAGKNAISGGTVKDTPTTTTSTAGSSNEQIYDSSENYDNYTLPTSFDYSSSSSTTSSSGTLSKVVGYAVVGLVLLVVADKLMGK